MKIADLDCTESEKKVLCLLTVYDNTNDIALRLKLRYATVNDTLNELLRLGHVTKHKNMSNKNVWKLKEGLRI